MVASSPVTFCGHFSTWNTLWSIQNLQFRAWFWSHFFTVTVIIRKCYRDFLTKSAWSFLEMHMRRWTIVKNKVEGSRNSIQQNYFYVLHLYLIHQRRCAVEPERSGGEARSAENHAVLSWISRITHKNSWSRSRWNFLNLKGPPCGLEKFLGLVRECIEMVHEKAQKWPDMVQKGLWNVP